MRSRGLVVAIAVVLAVLAAAGVIVYTNSVRDEATTENSTEVVVSTVDIDANTALDPLIADGSFTTIFVPNDAVVAGAVTQITDLDGDTAAAPIFANEQIPASRLASSGEINAVGVSEGHIALGLQLEGSAAVNGLVGQGQSVAVYATFSAGTAITEDTLEKLLKPAQLQKFFDAYEGDTGPIQGQPVIFMPSDFTVTLVNSVKVLAVQNPPVDEATGRRGAGSSQIALDLLPEDASQIVFATNSAQLYLGLLPPENEEGYEQSATFGVPLAKVTGVAQK